VLSGFSRFIPLELRRLKLWERVMHEEQNSITYATASVNQEDFATSDGVLRIR